jgi:hypothetical protein
VGPFPILPDPADACRTDARTLEVAREAYFAMLDTEVEPTEQDLVDADLLRGHSDNFDLVDGRPIATPGGPCDGVDLTEPDEPALELTPQEQSEQCETDYRTFQIAIDAFVAQTGTMPENEQQLVDTEMIRQRSDMYDVVNGEIVAGDDSPCSAPPD